MRAANVNLQEFLQAVCPDGTMVLGYKDHKFHNTPTLGQEMLAAQIEVKNKPNVDVYFALASFKQGWHKDVKNKSVLRVRENVDQLRALWFDIDWKDGLSDPALVVAALREFSKTTGMPPPSILVHSGNGIHAYWPFTKAIPLDEWQPMADRLKELAHETSLSADLGCTSDACRVLRPPGTTNWKDPSNPKLVRVLYSKGPLHDPAALEAAMGASVPTQTGGGNIGLGVAPGYLGVGRSSSAASELCGSNTAPSKAVTSLFSSIIKKCGVAKHYVDTRGQDCSEPEWTAALQLLRHCTDGELYVHAISEGHIDYTVDATNEKYQQRIDNTAGPTLCNTLEGYRPAICAVCPHRGTIKTPLVLGVEVTLVSPQGIALTTWRAMKPEGMERKLRDEAGNFIWERKLRRTYEDVTTTRSINNGQYELQFNVKMKGARDIEIRLPAICLGNDNKLREILAQQGAPLLTHEVKEFKDLMTTWLDKLQKARAESEAVEQLGWIRDDQKVIQGFSAGGTSFLSDGTQKLGVRIKAEYAAIGKLYEPTGKLSKWQEVANFLTTQNNPAFVTMLASSFAAPLLTFTDIPGGILSIVSQGSGVGKSSAMRVAQAVWGDTQKGINAVDDTPLSVARKLGFLNNLPAFWDELRGEEMMQKFCTLAFQVSQGKEKTRLDSTATMREVNSWETMLVAASNESIFDYMGAVSKGSDAGVARVYEIMVDSFEVEQSRAEIAMLFGQVNRNYGEAGQVYSRYLADNVESVRKRVTEMFTRLGDVGKMKASERIWFAVMAALVVGAQSANTAGLTKFDVKGLGNFLMKNLTQLRARSHSSMQGSTPPELIQAYMQQHQDKALIIEHLNRRGLVNYVAEVIKPPKSDRIVYMYAKKDGMVRVSKSDFTTWLNKSKHIRWANVAKQFLEDVQAQESKVKLGFGTSWELPRSACLDMKVD